MVDRLVFSFQNLDEVRNLLDPRKIETALAATVRRVTSSARTHVNREVRQTYNIKAGELNQRTMQTRAGQGGEVRYVLSWRSAPLPIDMFAMGKRTVRVSRSAHTRRLKNGSSVQVSGSRRKVRQVAVTARIRKDRGRRKIGGAFPSGRVQGGRLAFERVDDANLPVRRATTLSVAQMINPQILDNAADFIERRSNIELDRNLRFQVSRGA